MSKTRVLLLVVLVATLAVRFAHSTSTVTTPQIVASVAIETHNQQIPETTLYVPNAPGLYRISAYFAMNTPGSGNSNWDFALRWNDDAGREKSEYILQDSQSKPHDWVCNALLCPQVSVLKAKGGTPISFFVTNDNLGNSGTYSLQITVEQLM